MQLRHVKNVHAAQPGIARVQAIAWSPNSKRLAVADSMRSVQLIDEGGERREKFALKSGDGREPKTFVVRGMAWSPDSTKLAVAQSDYFVCVVKLGSDWGERKSVCCKFPQASPATCICWPASTITNNDAVIFGTQEGKIKIGLIKTNKAQTLYTHDSPPVSVAASPDGTQIITGHQDMNIMRYVFENEENANSSPSGHSKFATHSCIPMCLSWGESVFASGNDCKISFYDRFGHNQQTFEYDIRDDRDFTVGHFNPSGQALAVASFNRVRLFNYNLKSRKWDDGLVVPLTNAYSITAMTWRGDGSRLVTGTLCGAVDIFDACLRRYRRGDFEFTYVSHNQVIVKRLPYGPRIVLKSSLGGEINRLNIHKDRFLVGHTATTLLVGDLNTCRLSEVTWQLSGREQYFFDSPQVCMVYVAGELYIIEYGHSEVLATCRTSDMNMHRISVRIHEKAEENPESPSTATQPQEARKAVAYLIDRQTIQVDDLITGMTAAHIAHNQRIDWLELNNRATRLLFRDKQKSLFLCNLTAGNTTKVTLLNFCSYVQWVPDSEVVVAQNRTDLCVWYSIDHPDRVSVVPIKGDVETIERGNGKTEVIVDEGVNAIAYGLDESLIEFGSAMLDGDYDRACDLLDHIPLSPETEAMWRNLSELALKEMKLYIAERCAAALGDVAKAKGLKRINELAVEEAKASGNTTNGYDHFSVRAEYHILNKEFTEAERIFIEAGRADKAMEMWDEMHRYDNSIAIAEQRGLPEVANLRARYFSWLKESRQDEKAGEVKESEGKHIEAIQLYLSGGVPARAAQVVNAHNVKLDQPLLDAIANALLKAEVFEQAGDFFERLNMFDRAIDAYKRGHHYRRAVELARRKFPNDVVHLEEEWGNYLVSLKQVDQAINHFIEANQNARAVEAAIQSRQWPKAVSLLESQNIGGLNDDVVRGFYKQIGAHFEDANQLQDAEKYYVRGGAVTDAVDMYSRRGMQDAMYRVAHKHLAPDEVNALFMEQAQQLEAKCDYQHAERMYLKLDKPDKAILMYKNARDIPNMLRLVAAHRADFLPRTHLSLGKQFEAEGQYKLAEQHYCNGRDWSKAVNMYRELDRTDDAVRVAKVHGGPIPAKQVVISKALMLDHEKGVQLLIKYSLLETGIDTALEGGDFNHALGWANLAMPAKLPSVFNKLAMHHEDQGQFREAEDAFIKANKPREAVDMYIHQKDFDAALRVAEQHDQTAISSVCAAQGRLAFSKGNFREAESLLLRANVPETLLRLYSDARMMQDAQRIAREYCPDKLADVTHKLALSTNDPIQAGRMLEDTGEFESAIDTYLRAGREHTDDPQQLVDVWWRAVRLSMSHMRHKSKETVKAVVQKLAEIGRADEAAKVYEEAEDYRGAISAYVAAENYEASDRLANRIGGEFIDFNKRAKLKHQMEHGGPGQPVVPSDMDPEAAIKEFMAAGDWENVMRESRKLGNEVTRVNASLWVQALVKTNAVEQALDVIGKYGMETNDWRFFKSFTQLAYQAIMLMPNPAIDLTLLHDGLYQVVENMKKTGQPEEDISYSQQILEVLHIYATAAVMEQSDMADLACSLMSTLPRYVMCMPADKAYYDAGIACRNAGKEGPAFVFLSRFCDIADLIEDGAETSESLDNSDFVTTDFPYIFQLPQVPTLSREDSESGREWIITKNLESTGDCELPLIAKPNGMGPDDKMWVGCLRPPGLATAFEPCAVSGMPVLRPDKVRCKSCQRPAITENWNRFLTQQRQCPWCKTSQSVSYM